VREHDFKDAENAAEEEHWFQFWSKKDPSITSRALRLLHP
jgi:hypothetical protein